MTSSGLALHTTTGELGIALIDLQGKLSFQTWDLGRQLANEIQIKLAQFIQPLSWQDLEFIAVAKGPGSYTSTRIGVVTAKTLAQHLQIPVYGFSTLMTIAWYHRQNFNEGDYIAVQIPAHNQDIFAAIYQFLGEDQELKTIVKEQRFTPQEWQQIIKQQEQAHQSLTQIKHLDKIAVTTPSLLEIAVIKNNIYREKFPDNWQNLTAFYE